MKAGRQFGAKVVLALITIVLTLFAAEIGVRLFSKYGYITPDIQRSRSFPYRGAIFARHILKRESRDVYDGDMVYPLNSHGYRGAEFAWEKPKDVVRVLVYGGSAVFDLGSSGERDWPHRTQNVLQQYGWTNAEIINAGICGHASFDSFGRLFAEGHQLNPDFVVLYNAWNDIKLFRFDQPLLRIMNPYREDPRLVYHGTFDWMLCHISQLYVRLRNRYLSGKYRAGSEGQIPEVTGNVKIREAALRQYRINLDLFVDCARSIGAVPILMTQARLATRNSSPEQKRKIPYYYTLYDHDQLCEAFENTDALIKEVGTEKGVPIIDAAAVMSGQDVYLYDHIHTTDAGSQQLAELLADTLRGLMQQKAPANGSANQGNSP